MRKEGVGFLVCSIRLYCDCPKSRCRKVLCDELETPPTSWVLLVLLYRRVVRACPTLGTGLTRHRLKEPRKVPDRIRTAAAAAAAAVQRVSMPGFTSHGTKKKGKVVILWQHQHLPSGCIEWANYLNR
jgi:hypothetical protein